jgi:hypothetical protein
LSFSKSSSIEQSIDNTISQSQLIFAFDFLHFSFPSQVLTISEATNNLSSIMTSLDSEIRK